MPDIDDLRRRFPHLGFGVYAYDPDAAVTLEIHTPDGEIVTETRPTLADCINTVFPEPEETPDPFG